MIYIQEIDESYYEQYLALIENLPPDKREEVDKLCFLKDKVQKAVTYNLLREALKFEYGLDNIPSLSYTDFGKPYFKSFPKIYFNLSHCDNAAVCAVDNSEIGVDVECIRAFDQELAEYVCNERELDEILNSQNPALAFTVLWTKKESYTKMMGRGLPEKNELRNLLIGIPPENFTVLIKHEYVITICKKRN